MTSMSPVRLALSLRRRQDTAPQEAHQAHPGPQASHR